MTDQITPQEYAPYYARYIDRVPEPDIIDALEGQIAEIEELAAAIPPDRERYRYSPEKWSVRELFGHLIDSERVFGYRAFCISRGEQAPLPSFDENGYIQHASYDTVELEALVEEFIHLRRTNLTFLSRLNPEQWTLMGTASGNPVSVRAITRIMAGHVRHHLAVVKERY